MRVVRNVALGLLGITLIALTILALRPGAPGTPVWVTQTTVDYGQPLETGQLTLISVPEEAIPPQAFTADTLPTDAVADRFLAERTIVTEFDLQGNPLTRTLQTGQTLLDLSLTAMSAGSLTTGDTVDIWGQVTDCGDALCAPENLASGCRVLRVTTVEGSTWAGEERTVLSVAIPSENTGKVLLAEHNDSLQIVLRGAG